MWAANIKRLYPVYILHKPISYTFFEENYFYTDYTHINYFYSNASTSVETLTQSMLWVLVVVVLTFATLCRITQQYYIIANFTLPAGHIQ